MSLKLYDTFTRSTREFKPLNPPEVGLYTCGPTVYNYAHIGNLRTYIFEDILSRVLTFNNYQVKHVMNITDVGHLVDDGDKGEDKMEAGSRRTGKTAWEIAEIYTQAFQDDLKHLHIMEPTIWCKATDHIQEQIDTIKGIEKNGYTYRTSDGIYFDTAKLDDYGAMANLDIENLKAGARIDMGEKRNPTDFALWKFSPKDQKRQMEWDSPWGVGFPGWHLECSAMSAKYLGTFFDIHCGGEDHIPVHHTNEIAQTKACYGTNLANFWIHGYFLLLNDEKMAKSSGEFLRIQSLLDRDIDPLAYRYFCLNGHYRKNLNFTWESLNSASTGLDRLRKAYLDWDEATEPDQASIDKFTERVNDDLDMPGAMAVTWEVVRGNLDSDIKKATLNMFDRVLGFDLANWQPKIEAIPEEITRLLEERQAARKAKDWAKADAIRDEVTVKGYDIEDTPEGPRAHKKKN